MSIDNKSICTWQVQFLLPYVPPAYILKSHFTHFSPATKANNNNRLEMVVQFKNNSPATHFLIRLLYIEKFWNLHCSHTYP
jgi:hypothetical protein